MGRRATNSRTTYVATPSVMESVLNLATQIPFRQVTQTLEQLTAGVISPMTVHRLVQRTGQRAVQVEEAGRQECFKLGEAPRPGQQVVEVLYTEADGVWVRLQRESQKRYEVKSGIAYTGWQRLKQREERYALLDKRVYCHANPGLPFWEGASLEWAKAYDWSQLRLVVVGGDGANWIGEGAQVFANGVGQLDGFHLARACGRALGKELGWRLYEAIRQGNLAQAEELLTEATPVTSPGASRARSYVQRQLAQGVDWRNQVAQVPEGARGLGTMESNGDKLVANRMKKRGMSWTIAGAQRLAKVIQLRANAELADWCCQHRHQRATAKRSRPPRRLPPAKNYHGQWLQVTIPALNGPHATRPWPQALRTLAYPAHRLN